MFDKILYGLDGTKELFDDTIYGFDSNLRLFEAIRWSGVKPYVSNASISEVSKIEM